jgi:hypothetical protein
LLWSAAAPRHRHPGQTGGSFTGGRHMKIIRKPWLGMFALLAAMMAAGAPASAQQQRPTSS